MARGRRTFFAPIRALASVLKHEGAFELTKKFVRAVRHEGIGPAVTRVRVYRDRLGEEHELAVPDVGGERDVLFVSACPGGTRRYRCAHAIEALGFTGRHADMLCFPCRRPDEWLEKSAAVVLQRVPSDPGMRAFCERARRAGKALIFDIDDLLFDPAHVAQLDESSFASPFERDWARGHTERVGEALALCDRVTVSTERLRTEVEARFAGIPVSVLPNVVSEAMQESFARAVAAAPDVEREALRVGFFSGTPTHDDAFENIAPALDAVLREREQVVLVLTGPVRVPDVLARHGARVERRPLLGPEDYPAALRDVDIHLAPLRANDFDACKSACKWLEAALVQRPLVASAGGAFCELVAGGRRGFTCEGSEAWIETLLRLVDDADLRRAVGVAAHEELLARWTTRALAPRWDALLAAGEVVAT